MNLQGSKFRETFHMYIYIHVQVHANRTWILCIMCVRDSVTITTLGSFMLGKTQCYKMGAQNSPRTGSIATANLRCTWHTAY